MTSISGLGSNAWATAQSSQTNRQARMQERMFQKTDSDGSGGVDATELQATLDKVASKSGISIDTTAADLLTQADANGDGSLSSDELGTAMQSVLPPPPSTMDFAQSRSAGKSGGAGDDLFGKVDTDSSPSVSSRFNMASCEAVMPRSAMPASCFIRACSLLTAIANSMATSDVEYSSFVSISIASSWPP